jgi:glycosyltransferase involved in cell wall biosynthesis
LPRVIILQKDKSQLDEPVYHYLNEIDGDFLKVMYVNDYGFERASADEELQVVPNFLDDALIKSYVRDWLYYDGTNKGKLVRALLDYKPKVVVATDLDLKTRLVLSMVGKLARFIMAVRSDKNELSRLAHVGTRLRVERQIYKLAFGALCGVSELTFDYYNWKDEKTRCLFPYTTDPRKFTPKGKVRRETRDLLQLSDEDFLFLAAVKFHPRENPFGIIDAFSQVAGSNQNARLIILGSGPQHAAAQEIVAATLPNQVHLPGYIPYAELQNYFFAADAFIHLPESEPWGVSVQDALFCHLPVIANDRVGSAARLMHGAAKKFIVKHGDVRATAAQMEALIREPGHREAFLESYRTVKEVFTADRVACNLFQFFETMQ